MCVRLRERERRQIVRLAHWLDLLLQVVGSVAYTFNKVGLSVTTGPRRRQWNLIGWWMLLLGIPPWMILFFCQKNWMVGALEAGSVPSVILGLVTTYREREPVNRWWRRGVNLFTLAVIAIGVRYSYCYYHGLGDYRQCLELISLVSYLIGTALIAQGRRGGWLCYAAMNIATALLMHDKHRDLMAWQQVLSLGFVIRGYLTWKPPPEPAVEVTG